MAISMVRFLEGVTGIDVLGENKKPEEPKEEVKPPADPWERWKNTENQVLKRGGVLILDGATGTEIERIAGREAMSQFGWSCSANLTYPDIVKEIHIHYLYSGSDVIIANTYCTNGNVMSAAGLGSIREKTTTAAVRIAKEARDEFVLDQKVKREPLVFGSMSCHPPRQEPGSGFDSGVWPDVATEVSNCQQHADLLSECGVDGIIVEMVWDINHGDRAVAAACATHLPVILSLSLPVPEKGPLMEAVRGQLASNTPLKLGGFGDVTLTEAVVKLTSQRSNIVAICIHHTPISLIPHCIAAIKSAWSGYVGVYPECGTFEMPHWTYEDLDEEEFVSHNEVWIRSGVQMVGGCCGIGPDHIQALSNNFKKDVSEQELPSTMPPPPEITHVPVFGDIAPTSSDNTNTTMPVELASLGSVGGPLSENDPNLSGGLAPPPVFENDTTSIERISGVATDIVTQTPSPNLSKSEISVSSSDPVTTSVANGMGEGLVVGHFGVHPATGPLADFAAASPFAHPPPSVLQQLQQQQQQPPPQVQSQTDSASLPPPPVLDALPSTTSFSDNLPPIDSHYEDEEEVTALPPA